MTRLEAVVLERFAAKHDSVGDYVRRQAAAATVISRELTGAGFYTRFSTPMQFRIPAVESLRLSGVAAELDNLQNGAGFALYLKGGVIETLEGFSYGEDWPEEEPEVVTFIK